MADYDWDFSDRSDNPILLKQWVKELQEELKMARNKPLFQDSYGEFVVPSGFQVSGIEVVKHSDGSEVIEVRLEVKPTPPPVSLGTLVVDRS